MTKVSVKLMIQMSGAPGSGKSTLARLLRSHLNGIVVDHDVLRSVLLSGNDALPFASAAKQAYTLQWNLCRDFARQSIDAIIIDSPCNYDEVTEQGSAIAAQNGYDYWYIECRITDMDLLDKRLRGRAAIVSQRSAIDCPPLAAQNGDTMEDGSAETMFARWMKHPCRPRDSSRVILLDATKEPHILCSDALTLMATC